MNKPCSVRIFFMVAILSFSVTSCSYFEKKEASKAVSEFMEACIAEDYSKMRELYPSLFYNFPETRYKTDHFKIENVEYENKYSISVSVNNIYTNPFGKVYEKKMKFVVGKDSISMFKRDQTEKEGSVTALLYENIDKENKFVMDRMVIYDSYGFTDIDENNKRYMFGRKFHPEKKFKTDCEKLNLISRANFKLHLSSMFIINDIDNFFKSRSNININYGFWCGNLMVENISLYTFSNVKYELYGIHNDIKHLIACDNVCYDYNPLSPDEIITIPIYAQGNYYPKYKFEFKLDIGDVENSILNYELSKN